MDGYIKRTCRTCTVMCCCLYSITARPYTKIMAPRGLGQAINTTVLYIFSAITQNTMATRLDNLNCTLRAMMAQQLTARLNEIRLFQQPDAAAPWVGSLSSLSCGHVMDAGAASLIQTILPPSTGLTKIIQKTRKGVPSRNMISITSLIV